MDVSAFRVLSRRGPEKVYLSQKNCHIKFAPVDAGGGDREEVGEVKEELLVREKLGLDISPG